MINLDIPGWKSISIKNIVFDYNGTLAVDGKISKSTKKRIKKLKDILNIYILTADTYGTVKEECRDLGVGIKTFPQENAGREKKRIIQELGNNITISVGNGFNDIPMSEESILSIGIIGEEGACGQIFNSCDIVVNNLENVFDILDNTDRIKATLRN
ncbi:MAG TPA: ATPase P [Tissierellaceae bacterium]|nr:ATPase P [Tissierellaceae bacterium]